jgi:hypothetical protein
MSRLKVDILAKLPQVDAGHIINAGATDLRTLIPSSLYEGALQVYNPALVEIWYISVVPGGVLVFIVLGLNGGRRI